MNKVMMMGRLTRDPEERVAQGTGNSVAKFSLAVDRPFKKEGQPDADFFNCTTFGKRAEFVGKYLKKGSKVVIVGSLQNNNYTDKNGVQRYDMQIMVDEIEFAESKKSEGGAPAANAPAPVQQAPTGFNDVPTGIEDELPFA